MPTELWERIRLARKQARLSQEQLGNACDPPVSKAAVGMWESANPSVRTGPKLHNLMRIARATGVEVEWLLGETKDGPSAGELENQATSPFVRTRGYKLVPLISWVQAGSWAQAIDNFAPGDADEWLPCPAKHGAHTYALRIKGDSMTAPYGKSYPDGSIIFVDPDKAGGVTTGDRVIAKLKSHDEVTFKCFVEDVGRRFLKALNPTYPPITDAFSILGKVIGKYEAE